MFRPIVHMLLHLVVPGVVARWLYADYWRHVWVVMLLTMAVDLDHLFAEPVYAPGRCSVGFHPLHSYWAIGAYVFMTLVPMVQRLVFPKYKHPQEMFLLPMSLIPLTGVVGLGLLIHMVLDGLDCFWMSIE